MPSMDVMCTIGTTLVHTFLWHTKRNGVRVKSIQYDTCVANKMTDEMQCTIAWYADDTKISHVDDNAVSHVIEKIEDCFGKMAVMRGREHTFLGMNLSFHEDGTASIKMKEYIKQALADFGESITNYLIGDRTPAKKNLYKIDGESGALSNGDRETFHSIVAKVL
jgi:hypothetical protein